MTCGRVAFAPYFPPGSLSIACKDMLSKAECIILQNHGVVTIGSSLKEAFDRFVTLEYLAQTIINALPIGVPRPLKEDILDTKQCNTSLGRKFLQPISKCPHHPCCCQIRSISGKEKEARSELCQFVTRAYEQNIFTSASGSMSTRIVNSTCTKQDEVSYLITPTDIDRQHTKPYQLCFISNASCNRNKCPTLDENDDEMNDLVLQTMYYHPRHTDIKPSHASEIHAMIYSMHPEVQSIIIAQPLYATAFCITGKELNASCIPESHLVLGNVISLPFECLENGGINVSRALNLSEGISTVLINGFGLISVASTSLKAYIQVEVCESLCGVMLTAMRRGPPVLMSDDQVKEIDVLFKGGHST